MTKREMFEQMVNGTIDAEVLREFAEKEIAKLDHANEKAAERRAIKAQEDEPLMTAILGVMSDTYMTASEIVEAVKVDGLTVSKVSALMKKMPVKSIDGREVGSGNRKVYALAE